MTTKIWEDFGKKGQKNKNIFVFVNLQLDSRCRHIPSMGVCQRGTIKPLRRKREKGCCDRTQLFHQNPHGRRLENTDDLTDLMLRPEEKASIFGVW